MAVVACGAGGAVGRGPVVSWGRLQHLEAIAACITNPRPLQIKVRGNAGVRSENGREYLLEEEQRGESEVRHVIVAAASSMRLPWQLAHCASSACNLLQIEEKCADLQAAISEGANSFLFTEYKYVSVFMVRRCCRREPAPGGGNFQRRARPRFRASICIRIHSMPLAAGTVLHPHLPAPQLPGRLLH
jgi:hypothetical protein